MSASNEGPAKASGNHNLNEMKKVVDKMISLHSEKTENDNQNALDDQLKLLIHHSNRMKAHELMIKVNKKPPLTDSQRHAIRTMYRMVSDPTIRDESFADALEKQVEILANTFAEPSQQETKP